MLEQSILAHLDGNSFYRSFVAGANRVFTYQEEINRINLYPVPDADTGTNLAATMRAVLMQSSPSADIRITALAMADAALMGARGNSGIIFAQFMQGLVSGIDSPEKLKVQKFASLAPLASQYAYNALANPVEGTMLTVIRVWADFIHSIRDKADDFVYLLSHGLARAKEELLLTTKKLEVLNRAKVVDAGAHGFVLFLEGMLDFFLSNGKVEHSDAIEHVDLLPDIDYTHSTDEYLSYKYCTEALIEGKFFDQQKMNRFLSNYGDSVVVALGVNKARVHIHTDDPASLFIMLRDYGKIVYQKVDNMYEQQQVFKQRKYPIALVTDSVCDLPDEIRERFQIQMIPINLFIDDNQFLDKVTMTADFFYQLFETAKNYPTSSQPASMDFINRYHFLLSHYDSVIAVHLSSLLSGTYYGSKKAAEGVVADWQKKTNEENEGEIEAKDKNEKKASVNPHKKIDVIDSHTLSGALGLLLMRAANALDKGMSHDELVKSIEVWRSKTEILVSPKTLKYFLRGGRLSPLKGWLARLIHVLPIIVMDENGKAKSIGKAFTQKSNIRKILKYLSRQIKKRKVHSYAVLHANNPTMAADYEVKLIRIFGKKPVFVYSISPVVALNAGLGAVAVAVMYE